MASRKVALSKYARQSREYDAMKSKEAKKADKKDANGRDGEKANVDITKKELILIKNETDRHVRRLSVERERPDRAPVQVDAYQEFNDAMTRMIANKHGLDYTWKSLIRRLMDTNDSATRLGSYNETDEKRGSTMDGSRKVTKSLESLVPKDTDPDDIDKGSVKSKGDLKSKKDLEKSDFQQQVIENKETQIELHGNGDDIITEESKEDLWRSVSESLQRQISYLSDMENNVKATIEELTCKDRNTRDGKEDDCNSNKLLDDEADTSKRSTKEIR